MKVLRVEEFKLNREIKLKLIVLVRLQLNEKGQGGKNWWMNDDYVLLSRGINCDTPNSQVSGVELENTQQKFGGWGGERNFHNSTL